MNHIETLRQYNEWRRHDSDTDDPPAMPNPTEIGLAIDWAIGELTHWTTTNNTAVIRQLEREVDLLREENNALRCHVERLREKCGRLTFEIAHDESETDFKNFGPLMNVLAETPAQSLASVLKNYAQQLRTGATQ